jgi:hypothetical protein
MKYSLKEGYYNYGVLQCLKKEESYVDVAKKSGLSVMTIRIAITSVKASDYVTRKLSKLYDVPEEDFEKQIKAGTDINIQ